jgi:hypothetical protein
VRLEALKLLEDIRVAAMYDLADEVAHADDSRDFS